MLDDRNPGLEKDRMGGPREIRGVVDVQGIDPDESGRRSVSAYSQAEVAA